MSLQGRVALVIGGSSGIGRACADALAAQGASVVIADINVVAGGEAVAQISAAGGAAEFVATDVLDEAAVRHSVGFAVARFGGLDILVTSVSAPLEGTGPVDAWENAIDLYLRGPYLASRHALPFLLQSGRGAIVHIASIAGIRGSLIGGVDTTAYPSSKHGVLGLTKTLALHYGSQNIRVNAICPGYIKTAATRHLYEADTDGTFVRDTLRVPLGRWGEPAEIGRVAAFLASDDASFINGEAIVVDGGMTAR